MGQDVDEKIFRIFGIHGVPNLSSLFPHYNVVINN